MRRATALAVVALLAAIIAGFALGYVVGNRPRPLRMKQMTLLGISRDWLLDSLDLTTAQRQRVDSILTEAQARADGSIESMYRDVLDVTHDARERVSANLNASQRAKLDSILSTVTALKPRSPLPPRTSRGTSR